MRFTTKCCATEGMEETFDRYEELLERDPAVQIANVHVRGIIGCIRDVLIKGENSAEALSLLDELDDEYVNLDTEKLKTLARIGCYDIQVAYELGQEYCELEKRRERLRQCELDERGRG